MEILRIAGIGLTGGFISILIRRLKPEFSMMIPIVASFTVLLSVLPYLTGIVGELMSLAESANINRQYMCIIIKIIGISYLVSISAELCKDSGENAIASKIELGGKLIILAVSLPVINRLLGLIREIMNG